MITLDSPAEPGIHSQGQTKAAAIPGEPYDIRTEPTNSSSRPVSTASITRGRLVSKPACFTPNEPGLQTELAPFPSPQNHDYAIHEPENTSQPFPILVACEESQNPSSSSQTSPIEDESLLHRGSIRFLPRVRITSGLHGSSHRRSSISTTGTASAKGSPVTVFTTPGYAAQLPPSLTSTRSASASSSISAPLRFREQESAPSKWGPLGQRVSLFSTKKRKRRALKDIMKGGQGPDAHMFAGALVNDNTNGNAIVYADRNTNGIWVDETSPLLVQDDTEEEYSVADLHLRVDEIFGTWPGRLLNRHWWWWQIEPFVCCWRCVNDEALFDG